MTSIQKPEEKKDIAENKPNDENEESSEENSENLDQDDAPGSKINIDSFITTPYERVLGIINEAKTFILSVTKEQKELIKGLEWTIKVISSHSLYSYEFKDQDYLNQISEENPDFKQFVQFVNSYNDEVIQMSKRGSIIGEVSPLTKKSKKSIISPEENKVQEKTKEKDKKKQNKINETYDNINKKTDKKNNNISIDLKKFNFKHKYKNSRLKNLTTALESKNTNKSNSTTKNITIDVKSPKNKRIKNLKSFHKLRFNTGKKSLSSKLVYMKDGNMAIDKDNKNNLLNRSFIGEMSNKLFADINYPVHKILEKTFNIFELKEVVGYDKVLPIMGKVILDGFGLYCDDIISTEKLDPFLTKLSNQYIPSTLYHNSMHGADVTQSVSLFFLNSNAEQICQSLVLDILGILIASMGHDLGHPGYTNPFHINSSSELALTYNDFSCLENFHASSLFKIIKNPKTDIFEKLSVQNYKTIRKRMIGNILATDMANHGKIMTVIKSKISINSIENKKKFEILTGNENTKFEEQQSLFDFFIHSADLSHNTKLFNISLKWVELLSEEFWLQGDKEKAMKLPVSFLCDRESYNIPKSQIGFIKGFIIPTFECLVNAFPTLKYTLDNAKINLNKWQRLANKGRLKGWTPEKTKKVNYQKKLSLYNAISSITDNIVIKSTCKRKSGTIDCLSHELQIKFNDRNEKERNEKNSNDNKKKIVRPNIIIKTKNHDKKIHIKLLKQK